MEEPTATIKANGGAASVWERPGHHSDDENGHAIEYRDQREAIAAIKAGRHPADGRATIARITRSTIAAASRELETIRELGKEAFDNPNRCYQHHADAAPRQIAVLRDAGQPLPAWLVRDCHYFRVNGLAW